jgi:Holliday junction DNA helicase RuvA
MIATLRGRIVAKGESHVILDVGGVGFKVFVPSSLLERVGGTGQEQSLFTHMHVREHEIALYGCSTPEQLALFELLLGVSGIGPRVALSIVSTMSTDTLREAIAHGDAPMLTRIRGVGKKTAERLMLDLKHKFGVSLEFVSLAALTQTDTEVISALTSLGYSIAEAQAAVRSLPQNEDLSLEDRIRLALRYFAE